MTAELIAGQVWCAEHGAFVREGRERCGLRVDFHENPAVGMTKAPCRFFRVIMGPPIGEQP